MTGSTIPVRFHLSLNVSNLDTAVPYFEKLLQMSVSKRRPDYAKFELDSPPLVLSLEPRSPREHGSLNHLGFRFTDRTKLTELQQHLESMGVPTQSEEGVECCYAKQTKFWVNDFDHRLWEFYVLEGDIDHRGGEQTQEKLIELAKKSPKSEDAGPVVYEHMMGSPFGLPNHPCQEVRMRGTFNVPSSPEEMTEILEQAFDGLVPGGKLMLHILTSEEELCEPPTLSGPAAYVKHVPVRLDLMRRLEEAGFEEIRLTTFRSGACFEFKGHALRETKIEARRPLPASEPTCQVVFKGPFKELVDDDGTVWKRGEPNLVSSEKLASLKQSHFGELFVELPSVVTPSHCGA
jgi:hypothetical protein